MDVNIKNLLMSVGITNTSGEYSGTTGAMGKFKAAYPTSFGGDDVADKKLIFGYEGETGKLFYANGVLYDIFGQRLRGAKTVSSLGTGTENKAATLTTTYTREDGTGATSTFRVMAGTGIDIHLTDTTGSPSYSDGITLTANYSGLSSTGETMASVDNDVVTIYKTITETNGVIGIVNEATNAITLAKVAKTGSANDVTVTSATYGGTEETTNLQTALTNLASAISDTTITIDGQVGAITSGNGLTPITSSNKAMSVKAKDGGYISVTAAGVDVDSAKIDTNGNSTTTSDLATVKTVTGHIDLLAPTAAQVIASEDSGVVTLSKLITESAGVIGIASETTNKITFAKVATTGKAEDVTIADAGSLIAATTVEGALQEIAGKANTALQSVSAQGDGNYIDATFAAKDANNAQALTVSLKSDAIQSAADTTTYTNTKLSTASYVDEKVAAAIAGGVQYKGTKDSLPAEGANGDMYKMIADSAAGATPSFKAGDVAIYHTSPTAGWDIIPSGDDVEYTGVKVGSTTVISATDGGDATFAAETGDNALIAVAGDSTAKTVTYSATTKLSNAVAKAETSIQSVAGSATEIAKSVTQDTHVNVKVTATTDANKNVTLETAASLNMATVTENGATTTDGVATATDARNIAKAEAASATAKATVTHTAETKDAATGAVTIPGNLTVDDTAKVLKGDAVAVIKAYIDEQVTAIWQCVTLQ